MEYTHYDTPKTGIFQILCPSGKYDPDQGGWKQIEVERKIIGEDDILYIEEIRTSVCGRWVGEEVIEETVQIPIGINKTRLVRWLE